MHAMPAEAPGQARVGLLQHCSMGVFNPVTHVEEQGNTFQACIRKSSILPATNLLLTSNSPA